MSLPQTQLRECLGAVGEFISKRRPPPEIRDKVDIRADINGQAMTIISIRPAYNDPSQKIESPIAKTRWVGTRKVWRLFGCAAT